MSNNSLTIMIAKDEENNLDKLKMLLSEIVSSRGLTLKVTVTARGGESENSDRVTIKMFNSEIADDLLYSVAKHFVVDFEECLAENDEFVGLIVITFM